MIDRRLQAAVGFIAAGLLANSAVLAAHLGHPGTSTKGASQSLTQANLISDPSAAEGDVTYDGVFTYQYDPSIFSISSVTAAPGYALSSTAYPASAVYSDDVVVQTTGGYEQFGLGNASTVDTPVDGTQTGYVQVGFQLDSEDGTPGSVQTQMDPDGDTGDVTFTINFDVTELGQYLEATDPTDMTTFTSTPNGGDGNFPGSPDNYSIQDSNGDIIDTYTETPGGDEIDGSSSTFVLGQTPEPSCMALLAISGTLLLRRNRRVI